MARIPEAELERLKSEVSVQRLVEASGVELKKGGKDLLGKCPFHEDDEASLVVTPHKNLWHWYVALHRRGLATEYELVYDAKDAGDDQAHVNGLIDVDTLSEMHDYDSSRSGLQAIRSGSGRPSVGPRSGGGRSGVEAIQTRAGIGAASDGDAAAVKTRSKAANASSLAAVVAAS